MSCSSPPKSPSTKHSSVLSQFVTPCCLVLLNRNMWSGCTQKCWRGIPSWSSFMWPQRRLQRAKCSCPSWRRLTRLGAWLASLWMRCTAAVSGAMTSGLVCCSEIPLQGCSGSSQSVMGQLLPSCVKWILNVWHVPVLAQGLSFTNHAGAKVMQMTISTEILLSVFWTMTYSAYFNWSFIKLKLFSGIFNMDDSYL